MANVKEKSLIEVAELLISKKKKPQLFSKIFQEVCEMKGLSKTEQDVIISQFYVDLTISAKFVYCGNNTWNLKNREAIELWDKDGAYFNEYKEVTLDMLEEQNEKAVIKKPVIKEVSSTDSLEFTYNEKDTEINEYDENIRDEYIEMNYDKVIEDDKKNVATDNKDEDEYNNIMDQYEDMYED